MPDFVFYKTLTPHLLNVFNVFLTPALFLQCFKVSTPRQQCRMQKT